MTEIETENPYHIRLEIFEGPLDLLLHLIKENQIDIYNIPVSKITAQYLNYLDMMKELNLEVAGEFLVMAASLAHLKSQMLLPAPEDQSDPEEEGQDPRTELVRRLLEYQKYKHAAEQLWNRPLLTRDTFKREKVVEPLPPMIGEATAPAEIVDLSIFKLVDAFYKVLRNLTLREPHEVQRESIRVADQVVLISEKIRASAEGSVAFETLFDRDVTKPAVLATFLAVLEMLKRGLIRVFQAEAFSSIQILGTPQFYGEWSYDGTDTYAGQPTQANP